MKPIPLGIRMLLGVVVLTLTMDAGAQTPRPNILYLMADDIGWGDFQCYNPQGKVPSPNIDRLAPQGMRFADAHTPAARYNLADDLAEVKNLIADSGQAERVMRMEKRYREIRSSKRSTPANP